MSNRMTRKQRLRAKREREDAIKRFKRRGEIYQSKAESARERFIREAKEREEARIAARRAEHALPEGKQWIVLDACTGRAAELCGLLRQASIPFFRPQDEVEEVLPSGRRRMVNWRGEAGRQKLSTPRSQAWPGLSGLPLEPVWSGECRVTLAQIQASHESFEAYPRENVQ